MLLGLISPTSGTSYIKGKKVYANNTSLWKEIGSLVEIPYAYPDLTVRENLEIFRRLRFLNYGDPVKRIIDKLKLTTYADRKAKNLSLGNAQRLGLAKALMHNPDILILDEPSNGLDPAGIFEIRELLSDMAQNQGVTIFISSHILGEISRFASRIGIIHEGCLIQEINSENLEVLCQKRLRINTLNNEIAGSILAKNGYNIEITSDNMLEVNSENAINHPERISELLVKNGVPPTLINVTEEDLESYFLRTIGVKGGLK